MQRKFDQILEKTMKGEADLRPPFLSCESMPVFLLAVSGGMDSMCLAELFLHSSAGVRFEIAHCNFHLRGEDSDSDAALVCSWGKKNGVKVHVVDFDTLRYAEDRRLSIEMAARELRYRWFGELCRENGFCAVAVAHHADDNAETLFLNLVRGTGLRGICGMSVFSPLPCQEGNSWPVHSLLFRPLLEFTRDQIEGYVRRHGIGYHTDRTNADVKYRRNLIRNEVFPLLERLNPSFIKTVNREMRYFSQADEIVETAIAGDTSGWLVHGMEISSDGAVIDIAGLTASPHWEYRLYRILEQYGFNSSVVESVERLLKSAGEKGSTLAGKRFVSPSHVLATSSSRLIIRKASGNVEEGCHVLVDGEGEYSAGGKILVVEVVDRSGISSLKAPSGKVYMDAGKLSFPFVCRGWRQGDWIQPLGMRGKKKVSDLFADLKYDFFRKGEALLVTAPESRDGHVLALLGERIDDSVKITGGTERVIVVTMK